MPFGDRRYIIPRHRPPDAAERGVTPPSPKRHGLKAPAAAGGDRPRPPNPVLDADAAPGTPDREADRLRGLDVHEQRVAVRAEGRARELFAEPRSVGRRIAQEPVQGDVEQLPVLREPTHVVVAGAVLADDDRALAAVREVVRQVENGRAGRLEDAGERLLLRVVGPDLAGAVPVAADGVGSR